MNAKRILFICTGNTCRSVMAERLMRHVLQRAGIDSVTAESAGVFAIPDMLPTRETLRVLQEVGVDGSDHRARPLTAAMVEDADLIFVMESFHLDYVLRRQPSAKGKAYLLKAYGLFPTELEPNLNIPDPIGKPMEVYEVCFAEIREAVERIARSLGVHTG